MSHAADLQSDLLSKLSRAFSPRTVAVVGDKGAMGYMWLQAMSTFRGKLYSVQIDPKEIAGIEELGVPNYSRLTDIPGGIDYVLCSVPRQVAPHVIADCIEKGVGAVALFTSGFAETETEEGIQAQEQITAMAREAGLLIVGPNCMGIYNRELGIRQSGEQTTGDPGNVGFISQSGTHCINFALMGQFQGIKCSRTVSIGNAVIVDTPDYLEFFASDTETEVIGVYLEGVRDGQRLLRVLRETALRKPVVVWKGGMTAAGKLAAYSHTASLATTPAVWEAAMRQAGVVQANDLDETIDAVKALAYCKPATDRRMGLIAMTGGQSVMMTDAFAGAGLEVPALSTDSRQRLSSFFNIIGGSYRNPLDAGSTIGMGFNIPNLQKLLEILEDDENVDAIAMDVGIGLVAKRVRETPAILDRLVDTLSAHQERSSKPFLAIVHPAHVEEMMADVRTKLLARGIATFGSFATAAKAFRRATDYWRFRQGLE